jgi:hypothetical protein
LLRGDRHARAHLDLATAVMIEDAIRPADEARRSKPVQPLNEPGMRLRIDLNRNLPEGRSWSRRTLLTCSRTSPASASTLSTLASAPVNGASRSAESRESSLVLRLTPIQWAMEVSLIWKSKVTMRKLQEL